MSAIRFAVERVGGVSRCARICRVSPSAVCKWLRRDCLPRTEYTGETHHAQRMAMASEGAFSAVWLLANAKPVALPHRALEPKESGANAAERGQEKGAQKSPAEARQYSDHERSS
ncbi:hypothetical protein [Salinicola endophyticus]|uniref:hypothetical protein n=1 Tax=Salinicola endophyticus TaxID=1949083 RepID=UPI00165FC87C|nr:hypothetical protein [Salinicola endophyticus]